MTYKSRSRFDRVHSSREADSHSSIIKVQQVCSSNYDEQIAMYESHNLCVSGKMNCDSVKLTSFDSAGSRLLGECNVHMKRTIVQGRKSGIEVQALSRSMVEREHHGPEVTPKK